MQPAIAVSEVPVDVFILEDCPHDWLFPRCAAVVSLLFQTCQGGAMPCVRHDMKLSIGIY
jgi:hypothetical protein